MIWHNFVVDLQLEDNLCCHLLYEEIQSACCAANPHLCALPETSCVVSNRQSLTLTLKTRDELRLFFALAAKLVALPASNIVS